MISKNKIKFINSLKKKNHRLFHKEFVIEGEKIVSEIIKFYSARINCLYTTGNWAKNNLTDISLKLPKVHIVSDSEIKKISSFKSSSEVLAVINIIEKDLCLDDINKDLSLVLDTIQDPGNLGNIIRIADWFGIKNIICSHNSVDCYNPKVLQSSMGSIMRTNVYYMNLIDLFEQIIDNPIFMRYGTFIDGIDIYSTKLTLPGIIILGNESKGIKKDYFPYINQRLKIPAYNKMNNTIDSLNVAAATAIICAEFRKRGL